MTTLYLIRHCKAEGQEPDAPLTEEGVRQSLRLAEALEAQGIERIVSSPYLRAVRSVEPLAKRLGLDVGVDDRLRERVLSGSDLPDWMERLRHSFEDMDLALEGGESSRAASERALTLVSELASREGRTVAAATHGNLLALILKAFDDRIGFEAWKALSNPDVFKLVFRAGAFERMERVWS
jgi:2,3-bisphosphoglycerate-dependent phosphoglycerate mutase